MREVIFKNKRNPVLEVSVMVSPGGRITKIVNTRKVSFPFVVGQVLNMNHQVWACNNNYLVNGKDVCPEKKLFGIRVKDIPAHHPLRQIYPGKFK